MSTRKIILSPFSIKIGIMPRVIMEQFSRIQNQFLSQLLLSYLVSVLLD